MRRRYCCLIIVVIYMVCLYTPLSQAENMSPSEALRIIKEYQMRFDKYSSQELLDISRDEQHPAYSCLYFGYTDERSPLDEYSVYLCSNENGDPLVLKSTSTEYTDSVYVQFFIQGAGDYGIPCFVVYGNDAVGKPVKKLTLRSGDSEYIIEYKDKEYSYISDNTFMALCMTMFEMQIDILSQMAANNMMLELDITFEGGKNIRAVLPPSTPADSNSATYYLQALREAHYIDEKGNIQADIVISFPSLLRSQMQHVSVSNSADKQDKGYKLFGEKYGLTLTTNGSTGVSSSSRPWFVANVKNEDRKKTVDGFDLVYYGTSVYGDVLEVDRDEAKLVYYTVVKNIKPGQNYSTEKISFYNAVQKPKVIHVAIRRIHFSDGTLIEIPLRDLLFYDFEITY